MGGATLFSVTSEEEFETDRALLVILNEVKLFKSILKYDLDYSMFY